MKRCFRGLSSVPRNWKQSFPNIDVLERETKLLKSLKNLTQNSITKLDCGVSVVNLGMEVDPPIINSDLLFVRDFYPDLLQDLRKCYKSILLGNPGISKSFFHYYYMMRIFNPTLFGPLPPDYFGSCDPPELFVRQINRQMIQVYDSTCETVYKLPDTSAIFNYLDEEKSLYLMEPGTAITGPYSSNVPTLITVPPDTIRYSQFANSVPKYHMPCYSLEELLSLGKYLRENNRVPQNMENHYTNEAIEKRFVQFGGIIRHVFARSVTKVQDAALVQAEAVQQAIANDQVPSILAYETIEDQKISDHIAQYQVVRKTEGNQVRFKDAPLNIISRQVYNQLEEEFLKINPIKMIRILAENDENGYMSDVCPKFYEKLLSKKLTSVKGLTCQQQELNLLKKEKMSEGEGVVNKVQDDNKWIELTCKLETLQSGIPPSYANMIPNTLYYPTNNPFVEFFSKNNEGNLVAFQVTKQREGVKLISQTAFTQFLEMIKFPEDQVETKFKLICIPGPQQADTMHLKIDTSTSPSTPSISLDLIKTYTVLKIDSSYEQLK